VKKAARERRAVVITRSDPRRDADSVKDLLFCPVKRRIGGKANRIEAQPRGKALRRFHRLVRFGSRAHKHWTRATGKLTQPLAPSEDCPTTFAAHSLHSCQ